MKIALIDASPKTNNSTSGLLLKDFQKYLVPKTVEIIETSLHKPIVPQDVLAKLEHAETWVFACPLYVDGLPAHLLSCLLQLEKIEWKKSPVQVYGIVNCGFYEGIQAETALHILQNWCIKTGFTWCGGIGIGGGGALGQMPSIENGHGPKAPVEKALGTMASRLVQREAQENNYVSVAFPRFLYKMAAQMGWRQTIKKNGGKRKDLDARPN